MAHPRPHTSGSGGGHKLVVAGLCGLLLCVGTAAVGRDGSSSTGGSSGASLLHISADKATKEEAAAEESSAVLQRALGLMSGGAASESTGGAASGSTATAQHVNLEVNLDGVQPEEFRTAGSADTSNMKLMTLEDLNPMHHFMQERFSDLRQKVASISDNVDNVLSHAQSQTEKEVDTMSNDFNKFKRKAVNFQQGMQNVFSLLLVDGLHSVSGFCCCFTDPATKGDEPDHPKMYCRWNQAAKEAVFFKKQGCQMLGPEFREHHKSIMDDSSGRSLGATQDCGAFVTSALSLGTHGGQHGADRFMDDTWSQQARPPPRYLVNLNTEDEKKAIAKEWSTVRMLRGRVRMQMSVAKTACDTKSQRDLLKDAYRAYYAPERYTDLITQMSRCAKAIDEAHKMTGTLEKWDPEVVREKLDSIRGLLGTGGEAERTLETKLDEQIETRKVLKGQIKELLKDFKKARSSLNDGVTLWAEAVDAGIPAGGNINGLLETGLGAASDEGLRKARAAALRRHLPKQNELIAAEHNDREDLAMLKSTVLQPALGKKDSEEGSTKGFMSEQTSEQPKTGNEGPDRSSFLQLTEQFSARVGQNDAPPTRDVNMARPKEEHGTAAESVLQTGVTTSRDSISSAHDGQAAQASLELSVAQACEPKWRSLCEHVQEHVSFAAGQHSTKEANAGSHPEVLHDMTKAWHQICENLRFDAPSMNHMKDELLDTLKITGIFIHPQFGSELVSCLEQHHGPEAGASDSSSSVGHSVRGLSSPDATVDVAEVVGRTVSGKLLPPSGVSSEKGIFNHRV